MFLCSTLTKDRKPIPKSLCLILSLFLLSGAATGVAAITAREIVENAIDVYEDIDNYTAVVETYETDSMQASPSIFESQPPITAFNLFFRKPDEHAIEPIVSSRQGIFRVEPISALGNLRDKELNLEARETLRGKNCYVVACASPDRTRHAHKTLDFSQGLDDSTIYADCRVVAIGDYAIPISARRQQTPPIPPYGNPEFFSTLQKSSD